MNLVLCVGGTSVKNGIVSTNGVGEMLEYTVWKETIFADDFDSVIRD